MADLNTRIEAVIRERLAVAREAHPGPWEFSDRGWQGRLRADAPYFHLIVTADEETTEASRQDFRFMEVFGPDDAILGLEHALGILERHPRYAHYSADVESCSTCDTTSWACDEVKALAVRYGVEVDGG